ncbi:MAG TPA: hypothetical protein VJW20_04560 [Candidatus Angelobacter sp.]|nr:hypothetical protein [Candidatus Angelobacter sp.]
MVTETNLHQLWIGLVEVRPGPNCDILDGGKGAFVNIVTWAANADEYERKARLVLDELHLDVVGVENAEPVDARRAHEGSLTDSIEDMVSRAEGNPNAIIYGTFHIYEKDNAY